MRKARAAGCEKLLLTERGVSFGYHNLVVDMRSFPVMREFGAPVVFDVTHSLQLPGGLGDATGGQSEFIEPLARAGVACGVDAVFMEVHDCPARALSDGPNALPLERMSALLEVCATSTTSSDATRDTIAAPSKIARSPLDRNHLHLHNA